MRIVAGGIPLGDDFYQARQECVKNLRLELENCDILLIGPRRTGKTSVIKEFLRQEKEKDETGHYSIFIDLERVQNLYEFYFVILKSLYQSGKRWKLLLNNGANLAKSITSLFSGLEFGANVSSPLEMPIGINVTIKVPKTENYKRLEALSQVFREKMANIQESITIVLDEFPELIWKFGQGMPIKEQHESRKFQTQYLLAGLRSLRQESNQRTKKIILAGSINLPKTLEHIELEHTINDLRQLKIPLLTKEQNLDMAGKLVEGEDIQIANQNFFALTIKNQFGSCAPFYTQLFAENLKQLVIDRNDHKALSDDDIKLCYKNMLICDKGPRYLKERIKKYYYDTADKVDFILAAIAKSQFSEKKPVNEKCLNSQLEERFKIGRPEISQLIGKMFRMTSYNFFLKIK